MRIIFQHDERDCGAACLAMIANHYKIKLDYITFCESVKCGDNGCSVLDIVNGAKKINLNAIAYETDKTELLKALKRKEIRAPFIAHTVKDDIEHFVVIAKATRKKVVINDPGSGKYTLKWSEFEKIWTSRIITFSKGANYKQVNQKNISKLILTTIKEQKGTLFLSIVLSVIIVFLGIFGSLMITEIVDHHVQGAGEHEASAEISEEAETEEHGFLDSIFENLDVLCLTVIAVYVIRALFFYFRNKVISRFAVKIDSKFIYKYFCDIMHLPIKNLNKYKKGDLLSRFSDATEIKNAIAETSITVILNLVVIIGCSIVMILLNFTLYLIALVILLLYVAVNLLFIKPLNNSYRTIMNENAKTVSCIKESIDGVESIKTYNAENYFINKTRYKIKSFMDSVFKGLIISSKKNAILSAIKGIGIIAFLYVAVHLVGGGIISVGIVVGFYSIMEFFITPAETLSETQQSIQNGAIALERLNDIFLMQKEDKEDGIELGKVNKIEFKNVCIGYGNNNLIENAALIFEAGEKVAIIGDSGTGKSSLVKTLLKFLPVNNGEILLNGKNLNDYNIQSVRDNIIYSPTNPALINGSIVENICFGKDVNENDFMRSCETSGVLEGFDNGLYHIVDEFGSNLSSGQKQRVEIARAILHNPSVYIFDEATNDLDILSTDEIYNKLFATQKDKIFIAITHRLNDLEKFDKIYLLKDKNIRLITAKEAMSVL